MIRLLDGLLRVYAGTAIDKRQALLKRELAVSSTDDV
jgi:hypothetical protein